MRFRLELRKSSRNGNARRRESTNVICACRGWLRVEVIGLYRSPALADWLEHELGRVAGVSRVEASTLTGRVLVVGGSSLTTDAVLKLIDRALADFAHGKAAAITRPRPNRAERRRARSTRAPDGKPRDAGRATFWHTITLDRLREQLGSDQTRGLTAGVATDRLTQYGPNVLPEQRPRSGLDIALGQFKSVPVLLLLGSAAVSIATAGVADALVIVAVVAANAAMGYFTESTAERTIRSLGANEPTHARVLRDGLPVEVPIEQVVPGDVLVIERGTYVPADARLLEVDDLTSDESALTGESLPVRKATDVLDDPLLPLGDRSNMVFRGTVITGGRGRALVVETGAGTEIGHVRTLLDTLAPPETGMQRELAQVGRYTVAVAGGASALVLGFGLMRGEPLLLLLRRAISLAIAAVPEGLPTVATTTLALGLRRMQAEHVLVRKLDAIETLGAVEIVCFDKTGTVTENRMSVSALVAGDDVVELHSGTFRCQGASVDACSHPELRWLCDIGALCSEVVIERSDGRVTLQGSATEAALVRAALDAGVDVDALRARYPLLAMRERAEGRHRMATVHAQPDGGRLLAVKGSPTEVLALCSTRLMEGVAHPLDDGTRSEIEDHNARMAGMALRVLGMAYRLLPDGEDADETGLTWVGMTGMSDPPRAGVSELVARFHSAGIATVLITGDQSATAYAIGRELGLSREAHIEVLDSSGLQQVDDALLATLARQVHVFSRVSPADKLKIVRALQNGGRVVAMTGDGVNDGPALRAADVGIAMGATGSNIAREVADVVLAHDDLQTLIAAIRQGRTIYDDIQKAVRFIMATNLSEVIVEVGAAASGVGGGLSPMQLLWINLVSDVLPELALAAQPADSDVLARPPRPSGERFFGARDLKRVGLYGGCIAASGLGAYAYGVRGGNIPRGSTLAFLSLAGAQLLHTVNARSEFHGIFDRGKIGKNPFVPLSILSGLGSTLLAQLTPLRRALGSAPITGFDWAVVVLCSLAPFFAIELEKAMDPFRFEARPLPEGGAPQPEPAV